ncbi:MAG TPA: hypothetical protein VGG28_13920 [Kofleriaceae bacterium]|jgi:hypothetical protein
MNQLRLVAIFLCLSACKDTVSWEHLRNEHCSAISDLRATTRSSVAQLKSALSLSLFRPLDSGATNTDKWSFNDHCRELERDVRDVGLKIDGFITGSRAIVTVGKQGEFAGLSDRFEDGMMMVALSFFQGCDDDRSAQVAAEDLGKAGTEVDAAFEDAIDTCRAAGWTPR